MAPSEESQLAGNVLLFCRTLRAAGIPVGPAQVLNALHAVLAVGITRRDDLCHALRAVLVTDPAHFRVFEQAFHVYFRNPRLLERVIALLLPRIEQRGEQGKTAIRRLAEAMREQAGADTPPVEEAVVDVDRSASYSAREHLRARDFEDMSLDEQREARDLLSEELRVFADVRTRRYRLHPYGKRIDLRRSMQSMMRNNGQLMRLARKRHRRRPPVLVLICDISGSMSRYSRMFLHFAHVLSSRAQTVHTFVFGTRLTNVSRRLAERDVDLALEKVAADVVDWDGGTRIAESLRRFNVDWGRRVLAQNAIVVLLSDGLERDTDADLDVQMQRLHRSCRSLIWLNPMLRFDAFEPRAFGVRAMLPHVDAFLPAHNLDSLTALAGVLRRVSAGAFGRMPDRLAA